MSKKTYNPNTGHYDSMLNRYKVNNYWESQPKEIPDNYVELPKDLSKEDQYDLELKNDYYDAVNFEENKNNYDLINKSGYHDVLGLTAYQYNHILESQNKYSELVNKYGINTIMDRFNLNSDDIVSWNKDVKKPNLLSNLSDEEIKTIADDYIIKANDYYTNVTKPAKESLESHQEQLLKDNTFLHAISHFSDLPIEKQEDIKLQLKQRGISYYNDEGYNKVFINSTFQKIFGKELFKKTSYPDRERMVKDYSISSLIDNKFKDDPLLFRIQNLDTQDKIDLYNNSLFLNYNDAIKEEDRGNKEIEETADLYGSWAEDGGPSGGVAYEWVRKKLENNKTIADKKNQDLGVSAFEKRDVLLEEYERKSNEKKIDIAKPNIENNKEQYKEGLKTSTKTIEEIEQEFDETFSEILPHYWVFKDDWELKNFTLQDKIDYLSTYKALAKEDPLAAMQVVNDMIKKYIDDEQGFITHAGYGIMNAGIGTVAELINMANGLIGLASATGGADTYAKWMNTGWVNYWNDVSNYNTLNFNKHELYDQYGGVSSWKGVAGPGEEYDIFDLRTLEEVFSMGKYVMSITAATAGGVGLAGVAGRALGLTGEALNTFMNTAKVLSQGFAASGMAQSMAKGTFDETYQKLQQQVSDRVNFELNNLTKNPTIQTQVINEWLNSDLINEELNKTLKQAEQEWNKQNRIAKEKGTSLQMSKEQYLNNIKNEFLNAAYQDATSNVDNLVKNKYSQEIKNKHSLYSEDEMLEASARAAMIQASMSWVKEFAAGFLWNKWMIHKNARLNIKPNPMDGLRATETGVEAVKKAMTTSDYLKPIFTRPLKEFGDEWLDVHTEHFSQGFGLQNFSNITANMYDPYSYLESMNIPYNLWRPTTSFGAGIKSVADGFFDEAGIYEGLIGAVSGFGGINPNVVNIASLMTKKGRAKTKEELEGKNFLYNLNHFVSNSIISDIVEEQENIMQKEGLANIINETIKNNGSILQDVHALLAANAAEEKAYAEKDEEAIKNAGVRVAFQLAMTLRDENLGALPQIQQKVADLERFSKGEITEEDIKLHRKQMQNNTTDAISDEEVIADLTNNSKRLLDIIAKTNESFEIIEKSKYSKSLSQQAKTQLVFNRVYSATIDEELKNLETQIVGNNNYSTREGELSSEFSSEEGLAEYKKVQQETIDTLEKRKKEIQKEISKEKKGRSKDRNSKIQALELDLKAVDRALEVEKEVKQSLDNYTIVENITLSEDEILSLNPEKRAQMLNPLFKERYNKKQQEVIDNLIKRLKRENPEILDTIQLSGQLYTDKRLNEEAYDKIIENSDIYDGYVEYMQNSFQNRAAKAALNIIKRNIKEDLDKIEDSNLMQYLMTKSYSAELLEIYRKENVKEGTERERILKEVEDIFKTLKAIGTVINFYEDDSIKNPLRDLFQLVISKIPITNSKEFLQKLIDSFEGIEGDLAEKAREVLQKVVKLTNQINTTSEEKKVDREQREQENTTRVTEEQNQHKEAENTQQETKLEVQQTQATEEKPANTESPTIQDQAQQAGVPVHTTQTDTTDEGNIINTTNVYTSIYPGYEVKPLDKEGKLISKTGAEETDRMSVFYRFLENRGIKLQDIIDFELAKILKKNPDTKVYFAMHSTNDNNFNNYMFAVVEYNDGVRAIHDESRGGTFTTLEGKEYLIIGAVGTEIKKDEIINPVYKELNHRLVAQKMYYISNPSENDYFWVSNDYTQIKDIQAGRRVRSIQDSEVKMRSISELLYSEDGNFNEESNPTHLGDPRNKRRGYSSLAWAIQKGNEYLTINTGSRRVIPLNSPTDNNGAVFLLIETADGSLLPMYINPTFYNEITNTDYDENGNVIKGKLKHQIDQLLAQLLDSKFEIRKQAKEQLKQFLVLSDEDTITIGKEGFNSVSIKRNGSVFKTFNIDEGVNLSEFIDAIKVSNFRINVTVSALQTPGLIADYDEAGALNTDISVLHTRNASFTMYRIDNEGKPIIDDTPSYQPIKKPNTERQIQYGNKRYREDNGVFKDELDNIVEDKELIKKLKFAQQVEKMEPSLQEKGFNYYIIDDNKNNPIVVAVGRTSNVVLANNEQALAIIDKVNKIAEAKAKAEAAKKELEAALAQAEEVDLGDLGFEENSTQQQIIIDETITPEVVTSTQQTSSTETQKDINKAGNISLENLDGSNKLITFADIYEDIEQSIQLEDVFAEKGWKFGTQQEVKELLKSKNVPLMNITNFESWLDLIKNCR